MTASGTGEWPSRHRLATSSETGRAGYEDRADDRGEHRDDQRACKPFEPLFQYFEVFGAIVHLAGSTANHANGSGPPKP